MNSTEPTNGKSDNSLPQGYKAKLIEARRLRGKSGRSAYTRAKLLCEIFDDADFRADCGNIDDARAADILDDYIDDLCLRFFDLRNLLEYYPKQSQWRDGKLNKMYQAMLAEKEKQSIKWRPPRTKTVSEKSKAALEQNLEAARHEVARIRFTSATEIETLRARVKELESENAILRARIIELESMSTMVCVA